MIRLYLVRHGIALERDEHPEVPDESRPLTAKGRLRFRRASRAFARLGESVDLLFERDDLPARLFERGDQPLVVVGQPSELRLRRRESLFQLTYVSRAFGQLAPS